MIEFTILEIIISVIVFIIWIILIYFWIKEWKRYKKAMLILNDCKLSEEKTWLYWSSYLWVETFSLIKEKWDFINCKTCYSELNDRKCKICWTYNIPQQHFNRQELINKGLSDNDLDNLRYLAIFRQNPNIDNLYNLIR